MPEREPQTPERVDLRELGGALTTVHWEEVMERLGQPGDEIEEKICAYASKVISGEFPDLRFHHRDYLGARHWHKLYYLFSGGLKTDQTTLRLAIADFASVERNLYYTLDDYYADHYSNVYKGNRWYIKVWSDFYKVNRWSKWLEWSDSKKSWRVKKLWEEIPPPMGIEDIGFISDKPGGEKLRDVTPKIFKEGIRRLLLNKWLLDKSEVDDNDPLTLSPSELNFIVRNNAAEEILIERCKKRLVEHPFVTGWEKDI